MLLKMMKKISEVLKVLVTYIWSGGLNGGRSPFKAEKRVQVPSRLLKPYFIRFEWSYDCKRF